VQTGHYYIKQQLFSVVSLSNAQWWDSTSTHTSRALCCFLILSLSFPHLAQSLFGCFPRRPRRRSPKSSSSAAVGAALARWWVVRSLSIYLSLSLSLCCHSSRRSCRCRHCSPSLPPHSLSASLLVCVPKWRPKVRKHTKYQHYDVNTDCHCHI
jgi:hypothetical protein